MNELEKLYAEIDWREIECWQTKYEYDAALESLDPETIRDARRDWDNASMQLEQAKRQLQFWRESEWLKRSDIIVADNAITISLLEQILEAVKQ